MLIKLVSRLFCSYADTKRQQLLRDGQIPASDLIKDNLLEPDYTLIQALIIGAQIYVGGH